jgi:predicted peptidase
MIFVNKYGILLKNNHPHMKKTSCVLITLMCIILLTPSCKKDNDPSDVIETQPAILTPVTATINGNIGGYYEALPAMYGQTQQKYPLLIFLHGAAQFGNGSTDLNKVLTDGTPVLLKNKTFPPSFTVSGKKFSFIVLTPQFKGSPSYSDVRSFVDYALAKYRVDLSRLYVTGFSLGGRLTAEFGATDAKLPAAIVTMAGAYDYNLPASVKGIADNKLPVWSFHNEDDQAYSSKESKDFVAAINSYKPVTTAKLTIFPTSTVYLHHDCWTRVTDPAYKENGVNMYEWMLGYKR